MALFTEQKPIIWVPQPQELTKGKLELWGLSCSPNSSLHHLLTFSHVRVLAGLFCVLKSRVEGLLLERAIQPGDALMSFQSFVPPNQAELFTVRLEAPLFLFPFTKGFLPGYHKSLLNGTLPSRAWAIRYEGSHVQEPFTRGCL